MLLDLLKISPERILLRHAAKLLIKTEDKYKARYKVLLYTYIRNHVRKLNKLSLIESYKQLDIHSLWKLHRILHKMIHFDICGVQPMERSDIDRISVLANCNGDELGAKDDKRTCSILSTVFKDIDIHYEKSDVTLSTHSLTFLSNDILMKKMYCSFFSLEHNLQLIDLINKNAESTITDESDCIIRTIKKTCKKLHGHLDPEYFCIMNKSQYNEFIDCIGEDDRNVFDRRACDYSGIEYMGILNKNIKIYVVLFGDNEVIVGNYGNPGDTDAGIIFAPYTLIEESSEVEDKMTYRFKCFTYIDKNVHSYYKKFSW